jgi:hypothetical protein
MKTYLKDFEKYMVENHGVVMGGRKKFFSERSSTLPSYSPLPKNPRGK